jgi:thiopeptide-type bacteriocin biosynthesis protein
MTEWVSGKVFVDSEEAKNDFIVERLSPFVEKLREQRLLVRYHFLRYYNEKEGFHLRVRFLVEKNNQEKVEGLVRAELMKGLDAEKWKPDPYGMNLEIGRRGSEKAVELLWQYLECSSDVVRLMLANLSSIPSLEQFLNELSHLLLNQCGFTYLDEVVFHSRRSRDRLTLVIPNIAHEGIRSSLTEYFRALAGTFRKEQLRTLEPDDSQTGRDFQLELSFS